MTSVRGAPFGAPFEPYNSHLQKSIAKAILFCSEICRSASSEIYGEICLSRVQHSLRDCYKFHITHGFHIERQRDILLLAAFRDFPHETVAFFFKTKKAVTRPPFLSGLLSCYSLEVCDCFGLFFLIERNHARRICRNRNKSECARRDSRTVTSNALL